MKSSDNPFSVYGTIIAPNAYACIWNTGNYVRFRNFTFRHCHSYGAKNSNVIDVQYEDCRAEWYGGGVSQTNPRSGDGISFDGTCVDPVISNCSFYQGFDVGAAFQIFSASQAESITNGIIEHNTVDRCGAAFSVATHTDFAHTNTGHVIDSNICNDLGYGWSGFKSTSCIDGNSVHGRAFGLKNYLDAATCSVDIRSNIVDHIAWDYIVDYGTNFPYTESIANTVTNETGDYAAYLLSPTCEPWDNI